MKSPLYDWHLAMDAKLADFGGWDMPIEYPKGIGEFAGGTLAEHLAVRTRVGIFDVSHLGKLSVKGQGAKDFVNSMDNFRGDKKEELAKLAHEIAEQVKASGESVKLRPMNAFERKVVHDTIQEIGLTSESEGEDPNRCVVVLPE